MKLPVACTLTPADQTRRRALIRKITAGVREVDELDRGVRMRFGHDSAVLARIAELVAAERECCRFLEFEVRAEPDLGPISLSVTGPPGTRETVLTWLEGDA